MSVAFKEITEFTGKLVTFETTLPIARVISQLEQELHKLVPAEALKFMNAKNKDEMVEIINQTTGNKDFLLFSDMVHSQWLNTYHGTNSTPVTHLYTFGNPLIAQGILRHDLRAALNIPPRLLVTETEDHSGTRVLYLLPSSTMVIGDNAQMREAVAALDAKVEKLVVKVTTLNTAT